MARYTLYLLVMVAAALLLACLATVAQLLLAVSKEATFSGKTGKKIAFVSTRDTRFPESRDIYTMNPNGEAVHRLTNHPERYFEPKKSQIHNLGQCTAHLTVLRTP